MKTLGFLVVNPRTGYMLEGPRHTAKVFSTERLARMGCKPLSGQVPTPVTYPAMVSALLKGSAFCFDSAENHQQFLHLVRNDPSNKPMQKHSHDKNYVCWRFKHEIPVPKTEPGAGVVANHPESSTAAKSSPLEAQAFNPAILVR